MDAGTAKDYIGGLVEQNRMLAEQVRFWRETAQKAMENTDKALAVIELHKAIKEVMESNDD